jgi:hypothetical protein
VRQVVGGHYYLPPATRLLNVLQTKHREEVTNLRTSSWLHHGLRFTDSPVLRTSPGVTPETKHQIQSQRRGSLLALILPPTPDPTKSRATSRTSTIGAKSLYIDFVSPDPNSCSIVLQLQPCLFLLLTLMLPCGFEIFLAPRSEISY